MTSSAELQTELSGPVTIATEVRGVPGRSVSSATEVQTVLGGSVTFATEVRTALGRSVTSATEVQTVLGGSVTFATEVRAVLGRSVTSATTCRRCLATAATASRTCSKFGSAAQPRQLAPHLQRAHPHHRVRSGRRGKSPPTGTTPASKIGEPHRPTTSAPQQPPARAHDGSSRTARARAAPLTYPAPPPWHLRAPAVPPPPPPPSRKRAPPVPASIPAKSLDFHLPNPWQRPILARRSPPPTPRPPPRLPPPFPRSAEL